MPQINSQLPEKIGGEFDQAEGKLRKARNNRKARKKIKEEHFQAVRGGKAQSVPASQRGVSESTRAGDTFKSNPEAQKAARGQLEMNPNIRVQLQQTVAGGNGLGGSYSAPALGADRLGNVGSVKCPDQLMGLLGNQQSRQGQLIQSLSRITQDHTQQAGANNVLTRTFQQFAKLEQGFGIKEQLFGAKQKMYQGIAKTLQMVGKTLNMATQALEGAAQAVEAAASAVAGIPFVGAALSAALKVVAMMLKLVAKTLQQIGKVMEQMGQKMEALAQKMLAMAQQMKVQKLAMKAQKLATKARLDQGLQRLRQIQQARSQVADALGTNQNNQAELIKRLNELGRKVAGGAGRGQQPQAMQAAAMNPMQGDLGKQLAIGAMAGAATALGAGAFQRFTAPASGAVGPAASVPSGGLGARGASSGPSLPNTAPVPTPAPAVAVPQVAIPRPVVPPPPPAVPKPVAPAVSPGMPGLRGPENRGTRSENRNEPRRASRQGEKNGKARKEDRQRKSEVEKKQAQRNAEQKRKEAARGAARPGAQQGRGADSGGTASDVRVRYEQQLNRLSGEVLSLKGEDTGAARLGPGTRSGTSPSAGAVRPRLVEPLPGGPRSKADLERLNERQTELATLYSHIVQEGVEVGGEIEGRASLALEGSRQQPSGKIRIAREGQEAGGGAVASGATAQPAAAGQPGLEAALPAPELPGDLDPSRLDMVV
ncbi:MAG: hypothetical protein HY319_28375 [Armatimonadetes bacterium]|nr:hypothetical protein [Armatimonadota bacterium]